MLQQFFIDKNIARAKTLDKIFYIDMNLFELQKEKLFASSWQFIGNSDLVKDNGDVYPIILLEKYIDEPLILTKDKSGKINLLSNTCTHRGNIITNEPCKLNNLRCKYHGRLFQLDGKFISMPEFKEVENFPSEDDNLKQLQLFAWGKWLFTSLNNQLSHHLFLQEMIDRVGWLPVQPVGLWGESSGQDNCSNRT